LPAPSLEGLPPWQALQLVVQQGSHADADGAAGAHAVSARHEAAVKLMSNHERVLLDLTNPSTLNIEGRKLSQQFTLRRLTPESRPHVDGFLREVARRLIGGVRGVSALAVPLDTSTPTQAAAWVAAAKYLETRTQSTAEQVPGRAPDMSPAAAAAMKAVMAEVRGEAAAYAVGAPAPLVVPAAAPAALPVAGGTAEAQAAETALSKLVSSGGGLQKWLSAKASAAVLDGWNETLLASLSAPGAWEACCRAHFGPYVPPPDCAGWMLGLAVVAESLPLALTVSDCSIAGFPLVYVNAKFTEVTGYTKLDCASRNCRFLQGPGTNPEHGQHLLDTLRRGEDSQTMLLNYRKSGEPFENLLTMRYVCDSQGRRRFCLGFQLDLTGLDGDSGPWGKARLATEAGHALMSESRLKMSKLIQMLPKQIAVPIPPTPSAASVVPSTEAWSCPQLTALASAIGVPMPPTSGLSWSMALYALLERVPDAAIVVDMSVPMLPIAYANAGFASLSGWRVDEAVGHNCRFLQCAQTEGASLAQVIEAVRQRAACKLRITNARKDGSTFVNELSLHPVHDSSGTYRFNIGVLCDAKARPSGSIEMLRGALPTCFESELQPSVASDAKYGVVEPISQWRQYQPMTSKLVRLLWSTDADGAMRKFLTMPAVLSRPAIASLGKFLSSKSADDEQLLGQVVALQQRGLWSPMAGRTDDGRLVSAGAASALDMSYH